MATRKLTLQDLKWQREDDARTLARAQEIIADKKRHSGAVKEAKNMVKTEEKRAMAMKKVAAKKPTIKKKITKKKKK